MTSKSCVREDFIIYLHVKNKKIFYDFYLGFLLGGFFIFGVLRKVSCCVCVAGVYSAILGGGRVVGGRNSKLVLGGT